MRQFAKREDEMEGKHQDKDVDVDTASSHMLTGVHSLQYVHASVSTIEGYERACISIHVSVVE